MLENIDGFNGIKIVFKNSGFGIHVKRIMLFKSLNKRYIAIPVIRVNIDSKP
jgi:hypothetical protein